MLGFVSCEICYRKIFFWFSCVCILKNIFMCLFCRKIFYNQPSKLVYLLENIFNSWSSIKHFTNSNSLIISINYFNNHHHHHLLFHLTNISCTIIVIMSLLSSSFTMTTSNTTIIDMSQLSLLCHNRHYLRCYYHHLTATTTISSTNVAMSPTPWPSPRPSSPYHHHHH